MDVSSSGSSAATAQVDALKKSMQVQQQQIVKTLESSQQQTQQTNNSQKTGMGKALDIQA